MSITYGEAVSYIENIPKFTTKNTPQTTRAWLDMLGAPDSRMRIIHIAGTNGKGSVCAYLASILEEAGYTTGVFSSPHLVTTRERMSVGGEMISEAEFLDVFEDVRNMADSCDLPHPSYFEFLFLMYMHWIDLRAGQREGGPDYVILETGLGGRLDSTNIVSNKVLTIITRIGLDHMEYLGETIPEIAAEKAGILREKVPTVCLKEPEQAYLAIREKAENIGSEITAVGPDSYRARTLSSSAAAEIQIDIKRCIGYDEDTDETLHAALKSAALYQAENAALAVYGIDYLKQQGCNVSDSDIIRGLYKAFWPGRMEECMPGIYLDGAHNADGIDAFIRSASGIIEQRRNSEAALKDGKMKNRLLFSAVGDKQYEMITRKLAGSGLFDEIAVAPMKTYRTLSEEVLRSSMENAVTEMYADGGDPPEIRCFPSISDAFGYECEHRGCDLLFIAGSLYLVGEVKELIQEVTNVK